MAKALLLVDVIKDFRHEDGGRLLASFRERHPALRRALEDARARGTPVVYANDDAGAWTSDAPELLRRAIETGEAGDLVSEVAPREGDAVVLKPRYSAFDSTPLETLLRERDVDEIVVAGAGQDASSGSSRRPGTGDGSSQRAPAIAPTVAIQSVGLSPIAEPRAPPISAPSGL